MQIALMLLVTMLIVLLFNAFDIYIAMNTKLIQTYNIDPEFASALKLISNLFTYKLFLYIVIVCASSFFISHKIAGPLYRFEQSCAEIGRGNLALKVGLRKFDSLSDLREAFNGMTGNLNEKIKKIDALCTTLLQQNQSEDVALLRAELRKHFKTGHFRD